jgi:hypothetical protein
MGQWETGISTGSPFARANGPVEHYGETGSRWVREMRLIWLRS